MIAATPLYNDFVFSKENANKVMKEKPVNSKETIIENDSSDWHESNSENVLAFQNNYILMSRT